MFDEASSSSAFSPIAPTKPSRRAFLRTMAIASAATTVAAVGATALTHSDKQALIHTFTPNQSALSGGTSVVTNTNDSGSGSLRAAMANVADGGTITFLPSLAGQVITLTSGQLTFSNNATIDASALSQNVIISGNGASRVFFFAGGTFTLRGLTIGFGQVGGAEYGGGVLNEGATLTLDHCVLESNLAGTGGGLAVTGLGGVSTTLRHCVIANNTALQSGGLFTISNLTVDGCSILDNSATNFGGGLGGNTFTLINCTIAHNIVTGTNGQGGGIFATLMLMTNCTVVGNIAPPNNGGGIASGNTANQVNSSIVANNAGGDVGHIMFSGNNYSGVFTGNYNVVVDGGIVGTNNLTGQDPHLSILGYYGGQTFLQTAPPLVGSPCIDYVPAALCPTTDELGHVRPQGTHGNCTVGSMEVAGG